MVKTRVLPTISIITPSYNQAAFIERTIKSVLAQEYPNLEYIIIDGGSTDGTLQILEKYKDRIRWISESDKGQSDAINKGLCMSSGDILGYLNSDDTLLPGALKAVGKFFMEHPEHIWVTGYAKIINECDKEISSYIRAYKNFLLRNYHPNMLLVINFIAQMSTFWRKAATLEIGEFSTAHHLVMDYDYWLRLQSICPPGVLQQDLSCFRVHPDAKGSQRFTEQFRLSYEVARPYMRNPLLRFASRCHNILVVLMYKLFAK
jgi:glycosyltransferase involved in cell wall biosynthesis